MKIITGDPLSGKTTKLVKMAIEDPNYIIVCYSSELAKMRRIEWLSKGHNIEFLGWIELTKTNTKGRKILVDDVDEILKRIFHSKVEAMTMSSCS